jgi:hypothetical protein
MQLKGKIVLIPFPFTDLTATKLVNLLAYFVRVLL